MAPCYRHLENRAALKIEGEDRKNLLQGLISNDALTLGRDRAVWAALLTPQGKFLHEFCLVEQGETLFLEGEAERLPDLTRRLTLYKLRSKVTLTPAPELAVVALFGADANEKAALPKIAGAAKPVFDGIAFADPRLPDLGLRALLPRNSFAATLESAGFEPEQPGAYERLRIGLGIPDGSRDLEIEKTTLMEAGFDELGGIDWKKGCFIGQELTARMRYRGLVKRRLVPVVFKGPPPQPGSEITQGDKVVGELRSQDNLGAIALLRLEALDETPHPSTPLQSGSTTIIPSVPSWMRLPKV
ncbi:CAF17-like 4Fe-4S cluster assembly/insertion protein YgfZ [Limibacillus halophilus]|uniref:CAF17 C-terminal domain-containing protein n=1 Tax=Limibacillus halophilus TaxID=1579333 RepID=A0A839T0M8_9PROT|nr:folate-binding protein YgfZ [Limibacillus halophilus]MBB3066905.1 hypothetical protein [Limibacillus halophilus]